MKNTHIKISPSILSADFSILGQECFATQQAGADMLHIDVMDGHFVPNLSFAFPVIRSIRPKTNLPFDVHLMISNPLLYIDAFAKSGADWITFHIECDSDTQKTIDRIKSFDKKVGIALKPNTAVEKVMPYIDQLDMVLVMTVEPGFGGQRFMPEMCSKLNTLNEYKKQHNLTLELQVDGGIDCTTAPIVACHGATILVAGSAIFSKEDYAQAIQALHESLPTS
ncbi:MAG: ribulose-phosphate 3-epimerase [Oscillospiraceae bacterium]